MSENTNVSIFTVCNVAYLNKVMVLAESVFLHNGIKTDVFVFDKKRRLNVNLEYCNIHWIEDEKIPNFKNLAFKYTVIELTTALKPFLALKLLKHSSKVLFFDPDVMVFNSLRQIIDQLDKYSIIITPHYFIPKINGLIDDARLMRFGPYNLGFFAANNSNESKEFLNWWSERCVADGFDDAQFGIFTDQKWVSIALCFFPFIHVSYNSGLNVAFWNLEERSVSVTNEGKYIINNEFPLVFFHFSSFNKKSPEKLSYRNFNKGQNTDSIIAELGLLYASKLKDLTSITSETAYTFDYMSDGRYISPTLRRAYAFIMNKLPVGHDPFDSSGVVADFAKKNHLFQKRNKRYIQLGYNNLTNNSEKLNIVFIFMKLLLSLFGPNNFMNLSRLFVYLSSFQRIDNFWKLPKKNR